MRTGSLGGWFKGIKGKLFFTAFVPVIGFGILFAVSYNGMNQMNVVIKSSHTDVIPTIEANAAMRAGRNQFGYQALSALTHADEPELFKRNLESAKTALNELETEFKNYSAKPATEEELALRKKLGNDMETFIKVGHEVIELLASDDAEKLAKVERVMDEQIAPLNSRIREFNAGIDKIYDARAEQEALDAVSTTKFVLNSIIGVTAVSGLAIFGLLLWIASNISNSVNNIAQKLSEASANVTNSVEQLNEAGNSLSQSSTEAAASLEETVAALEELTSMVQMNSDNAKQAATLSVSSREAAEQGEKEIQNLIESMNHISSSSRKIEEIISVIDDIAFQTNLLALNASVEAARAGEQGKGFAVVAEAVRALAQRSAASAKDITALIKESVVQIEDGSAIADKSGTVLTNIVNSIKKVSDLNNEIAAASSEQTTGIQQIGKAMNQLDQSSQSNAASAEEIAATSGEINTLASTAQSLTVDLETIILGKGAEIIAAPPVSAAKKPAPLKSNIIPLKKQVHPKTASARDAIPFDEDTRAKVGGTEGF